MLSEHIVKLHEFFYVFRSINQKELKKYKIFIKQLKKSMKEKKKLENQYKKLGQIGAWCFFFFKYIFNFCCSFNQDK